MYTFKQLKKDMNVSKF